MYCLILPVKVTSKEITGIIKSLKNGKAQDIHGLAAEHLQQGNGSWYCTNCKADCGLCSGAVLYGHKAVQCDKCEMWIHNKCSLITDSEFDSRFVQNVTFFNFSDSFFGDQLNLENQSRFDPLANGSGTKASQTGSDKNKFISGLKFVSININSIRGKKLELLAFLDFHQPQIVAIQETIDSSISTSELFPESCPYIDWSSHPIHVTLLMRDNRGPV